MKREEVSKILWSKETKMQVWETLRWSTLRKLVFLSLCFLCSILLSYNNTISDLVPRRRSSTSGVQPHSRPRLFVGELFMNCSFELPLCLFSIIIASLARPPLFASSSNKVSGCCLTCFFRAHIFVPLRPNIIALLLIQGGHEAHEQRFATVAHQRSRSSWEHLSCCAR